MRSPSLWLLIPLAAALALAGCASAPPPAAPGAPRAAPSALDSVVADLCSKQVVLLGEPGHHGSGATLQAKVELVRRLTDVPRERVLPPRPADTAVHRTARVGRKLGRPEL